MALYCGASKSCSPHCPQRSRQSPPHRTQPAIGLAPGPRRLIAPFPWPYNLLSLILRKGNTVEGKHLGSPLLTASKERAFSLVIHRSRRYADLCADSETVTRGNRGPHVADTQQIQPLLPTEHHSPKLLQPHQCRPGSPLEAFRELHSEP